LVFSQIHTFSNSMNCFWTCRSKEWLHSSDQKVVWPGRSQNALQKFLKLVKVHSRQIIAWNFFLGLWKSFMYAWNAFIWHGVENTEALADQFLKYDDYWYKNNLYYSRLNKFVNTQHCTVLTGNIFLQGQIKDFQAIWLGRGSWCCFKVTAGGRLKANKASSGSYSARRSSEPESLFTNYAPKGENKTWIYEDKS
jgi:hypothetical protein